MDKQTGQHYGSWIWVCVLAGFLLMAMHFELVLLSTTEDYVLFSALLLSPVIISFFYKTLFRNQEAEMPPRIHEEGVHFQSHQAEHVLWDSEQLLDQVELFMETACAHSVRANNAAYKAFLHPTLAVHYEGKKVPKLPPQITDIFKNPVIDILRKVSLRGYKAFLASAAEKKAVRKRIPGAPVEKVFFVFQEEGDRWLLSNLVFGDNENFFLDQPDSYFIANYVEPSKPAAKSTKSRSKKRRV